MQTDFPQITEKKFRVLGEKETVREKLKLFSALFRPGQSCFCRTVLPILEGGLVISNPWYSPERTVCGNKPNQAFINILLSPAKTTRDIIAQNKMEVPDCHTLFLSSFSPTIVHNYTSAYFG